jgi:hypothetical protein
MLQGADDIIHQIGASQVGKWQYSFQSSMEMQLIQHDNAHPHTSL